MATESTKEARIVRLNELQAERKQQALEKVEQTIERMQKLGRKINFSSVAAEANVSQSYLYKYPEIKTRIAEIRNQQSSMPQPRSPESASAKSHQVIVSRLKDRIKKLEAEVTGLRNINEGLAGRVYRLSESEALVERQQKRIKDLEERLRVCESRNPFLSNPPSNNPKVTPLDCSRVHKSDTSDQVQSELGELDIKVNSTLTKLIKAAPEKVVLKAIEALKEALATTSVRNPCGFLVEAIRNTWTPNEEYEQKIELDYFNEWYPLAQSLKLVNAATQIDGVQHVLTNEGEWIPFSQILADYSLKKLREMV